jgi:hypothetical protein
MAARQALTDSEIARQSDIGMYILCSSLEVSKTLL